eukprot:TRINITY_DN4574_c0_g1_i1.p1 TRINITY_DN4574_c0_g1~~TRINITY_DN4574_c0_g1_i1.p1  ORF type:complete len:392 (+),score=59.60 TRINITY_DN4574_c0_g1_i1:16-1191(+)
MKPAVLLILTLLSVNSQIFNVLDFGAKGDGTTLDSKAIRETVNAIEQHGGGVLLFPSGYRFLTGAFNLTSHTVLLVQSGAEIQGSPNFDDYPLIYKPLPSYPYHWKYNTIPRFSGLIHGSGLENVTITGGGIINGEGQHWWRAKTPFSPSPMVQLMYSQDIVVKDITFKNAPFWTFHLYTCRDVLVDGYHVFNPIGSSHSDGIDIDSTKNVVIRNSLFNTIDDMISIKAGAGDHGKSYNISSDNIIIDNNHMQAGAGVAIGSEMAGGVSNVTVSNNIFDISANIVRFKSCFNYGGTVQDITYINNSVTLAQTIIYINMEYECPGNASDVPLFKNINLMNITGYAQRAGDLDCLPEEPCVINMRDINIHAIQGFKCKNVQGETSNVYPQICY